MRIVFMGTPAFAVPSLDILLQNGYEVAGVVTATDKLGGRGGRQLLQSAVKKYALSKGLPILQPRNLKAPEFQETLRALKADLQVVVAFRMLPESVWAMPPLGTFNLHASLLPKYRGAAPINWAIIRGEKETGLTTFFIQKEIDTGDILLQTRLPIGENETAGELHDRMMTAGAQLVLDTVRLIESGDYQLQKQDHTLATPAPKIFHDDCRINFNQDSQSVHNFIRGLSPYPGAWTRFRGKQLKLLRSKISDLKPQNMEPGELFRPDKKTLCFITADGCVEISEVKLEGKRMMSAVEFLNGQWR